MPDPTQTPPAEILQAAHFIRTARSIVALTGAGISTPSGIPDFRSQDTGQWNRFNPMDVASLTAFQRTPEKFYNWLRPLVLQSLQAQPNPAHIALAELEKAGKMRAVITQNIDGLHQKAGSQHVLEVHGSLRSMTCSHCDFQIVDPDQIIAIIQQNAIPRCAVCNHPLKPDIVLYEEMLPVDVWEEAERVCTNCDLMIVVGSSLEVTPVNGLPLHALRNHAPLLIVNRTPTHLDRHARIILRDDLAEVLPQIIHLALDPSQEG
ncbi:MAG: NAD-dependent deacylase [Anaerolineaceae bacterium]